MANQVGGSTIGMLLRALARQHPAGLFLHSGTESVTWSELDILVDRFASALLENGIRSGDRVAVWMANDLYWAVAFFACTRIGAILIPVNTRYKRDEVSYILRQSGARFLFMMDSCFGTNYYELLLAICPELTGQPRGQLDLVQLPDLRGVVTWGPEELPGTIPVTNFLREQPSPHLPKAEEAVQPDEVALIVYTSGTTGRPKGAMHSHQVLRRVGSVADGLHVGPQDVILGHMPFYHVGGLFLQLLLSLRTGAALVLMAKWDAHEALRLIANERITQLGGTPTHFYDLINVAEREAVDSTSMRAAWIGGAVDMREIIARAASAFPTLRILSTYGLTEATVCATMNRWDDPTELVAANRAPPLGDTRIRIVDPDTFLEQPAGQRGEIWLSGSLMKGYYQDPDATRAAITADGWLRTGDIGVLDAAGNLAITDRFKEMYKIGGVNAYPAEIEAHLRTIPEIADAVVVGVPDARLSEVGFAFVRLRPGACATPTQIISACRGNIADYKVPRYVQMLDRFPTTETGKIERAALKKMAAEQIASRSASPANRKDLTGANRDQPNAL